MELNADELMERGERPEEHCYRHGTEAVNRWVLPEVCGDQRCWGGPQPGVEEMMAKERGGGWEGKGRTR